MRNTSATATSSQAEAAFDPFGEPVTGVVAGACATAAGDRTARRIGGAVFWSLALLILAGRIYAADIPVTQTVASYAAQIVALR
ncbi:hypothetical protein [Methylobacterium persicinum]|uniref:Uncharacterized protein n=1 Tax=Methylobacterium persicinum TaxID=374426 RepID=A0ABU0HJS9_9HYPH|nr:hypothetical protein [Methylobacterium persicinum]MDQ0442579.1 hypothetical protein [Methylobacterium persicinum]GJE37787.1 hypothetical protein KHHGKMAE_1849 [Methylobacterium persicinum]